MTLTPKRISCRYIEGQEGAQGSQLYDMDKDPAEAVNLAEDPAHAATVSDLKARLAGYRR